MSAACSPATCSACSQSAGQGALHERKQRHDLRRGRADDRQRLERRAPLGERRVRRTHPRAEHRGVLREERRLPRVELRQDARLRGLRVHVHERKRAPSRARLDERARLPQALHDRVPCREVRPELRRDALHLDVEQELEREPRIRKRRRVAEARLDTRKRRGKRVARQRTQHARVRPGGRVAELQHVPRGVHAGQAEHDAERVAQHAVPVRARVLEWRVERQDAARDAHAEHDRRTLVARRAPRMQPAQLGGEARVQHALDARVERRDVRAEVRVRREAQRVDLLLDARKVRAEGRGLVRTRRHRLELVLGVRVDARDVLRLLLERDGRRGELRDERDLRVLAERVGACARVHAAVAVEEALPARVHCLREQRAHALLGVREERRERRRELCVRLVERAQRMHHRERKRVDAARVQRGAHERLRDRHAEQRQRVRLVRKHERLRVVVRDEAQAPRRTLRDDAQQCARDVRPAARHVLRPGGEQRARVELARERRALRVDALPVGVVLPARAKHVVDALQVHVQLALDLVRPHDRADDLGLVPQLRGEVRVRAAEARAELGVERVNVALHALQQHLLVLLHGRTHLGAHKQAVALCEDPQLLARRLRVVEERTQLVDEQVLDVRDACIVLRLGVRKELGALVGHVERVDVAHRLERRTQLAEQRCGRRGPRTAHVHHVHELLVRRTESLQVLDARAQRRMRRRDLDRDVLFRALAREVARDVHKLLHMLVPLAEYLERLLEDRHARVVRKLHGRTLREHAQHRRIRLAPDRLDERERTRHGVVAHAQLFGEHAKDGAQGIAARGERRRGEQLGQRKVAHEHVVTAHLVERVLDPGVRVEGGRGVEALRAREHLERERNARRLQLLLEVLERVLHRVPEVDLLHRRAARRVAVELRDLLHGAHPAVHLGMELVDELVVVQHAGRLDRRGGDRLAALLARLDGRADRRVHGEDHLRNLDALLQVP